MNIQANQWAWHETNGPVIVTAIGAVTYTCRSPEGPVFTCPQEAVTERARLDGEKRAKLDEAMRAFHSASPVPAGAVCQPDPKQCNLGLSDLGDEKTLDDCRDRFNYGTLDLTDPRQMQQFEDGMRIGAIHHEIVEELMSQDRKFGRPEEDDAGPCKMITVLGEEFGEACQAVLQQKGTDKDDLRKELIQVAAVAVKMIRMGDAHGWW